MTEGDPQIIKELLDIFRDQVVEIYDEMVELLGEKKYESLGFLAHKAKASVAIMGMDDLANMLKTFELQAKDGSEEGRYGSYIERFRTETEGAVRELEGLLKSGQQIN